MNYKIENETLLKETHPELFALNERKLVTLLKRAKKLGLKVQGVEIVSESEGE